MWHLFSVALATVPPQPLELEAAYDLPDEVVSSLQALDGHDVTCRATASRRRQDAQLQRSLRRLTEAASDAEDAVADLPDGPSAEVALGRVHEALSFALVNSDRPGYLTDAQIELYDMAIDDKAWKQQKQAIDAYQRAMEGWGENAPGALVFHVIDGRLQLGEEEAAAQVAEAYGHPTMAEELREGAAARARQAALNEAVERELEGLELQELLVAVERLRGAIRPGCPLGLLEEAEVASEQLQVVLDAQEGSLAHDGTYLAEQLADRLDATCF